MNLFQKLVNAVKAFFRALAFDTKISNDAAKAACDSVVDKFDAGSGPGKIRIYTGTKPAGPDTAITSQTLLAEVTLADPAFGAAADIDPGARATMLGVPLEGTAVADGTAAWFRGLDSDNNAIIDGTVGTSGTDMIVQNASFATGQTFRITSATVTMPEG